MGIASDKMDERGIMDERINANEIKKGARFILDIAGMNHEGQGVGRIGGFVVFADGALEGEKVEADIVKVSGNYAVAKLAGIIEPSRDRISPFCKVYGRLGEAVRDAAANAKLNGVGNVEFAAGKVEDVLPEMARVGVRADVAVLDPPRRGCGEAVLEAVAAMGPAR